MLQITQSERVNEKSVPRAEHEDSRVTAKPRFWNMSRILVYNRILYMYVCSAVSVWARLNQGFGPVVYTRVPRCTNVSGFKNTKNQNFYSDGGSDPNPNPKWKERKLIVGIQKIKKNYVHRRWFSHSQSTVESPGSFFDGFIICLLLRCSPVLQRSHTSFPLCWHTSWLHTDLLV